ncbi:restriction endonuclease subunit S [Thiohalophilus sp.]|uniref:restriction endonuclease subunit S n=1 Tax=Thiohalophilus sp. TaxID=3028392 RepID=UPI002ACE7BA3|nr:restriction endonuclease subunit S [Thiohalophilus sp.]MDZ7663001.1 restriction endonuclease subunit S [Thiohalophilus sp.]
MSDVITNNLDLWTSAILTKSGAGRGSNGKEQAYGIKKLRELILELAVRGKLVPQDPKDEPASVLLKKIAKEKARLVKEGKIRKQKPQLDIYVKEEFFEIPENWKWVRFAEIAQHNAGKTLDRGRNNGAPRDYITTSNLYWGEFDLSDVRQMLIREDELDRCTARQGDLLICEGGEAGRAAVWDEDYEVCFQNHIHRARFYCCVNSYYAYRYFEYLSATGKIENYRKGVGISNMSGKALASIVVPLPPEAEQHRIVAKVDELMALCDQLEQQQTHSLEAHQTLVETLLGTLTNVESAEGFAEAWTLIADHFGILFTTEHSIDQLKQTILQLAVMGKLVPQDPNDEPASVLLEKIAKEKARLIKDRKIKKQKPLPAIAKKEKPFALPKSWEWKRFGDITYQITDGAHHTPTYVNEGVPFLSVKDMSTGKLDFTDTRLISRVQHEDLIRRCYPKKGDLLLTKVGTTGIPVLVDTNEEFSIFVSVALIKFPQDKLVGKYLSWLVSSPIVKAQSVEGTEGVGNKNLVLRKIAAFLLAIPPVNEQHRIVAKIDELIALCNALKARLTDAQTTQIHLADAIVEQAIA